MRQLPSGTVTFLFTDIEGSTRLLAELGSRYRETLADHRRLLRDAVVRHGGVEVDTQGDAFFFAFARPSDAVAAAREAQASLVAGPVRVRMGLHTGEATPTDEGYIGLDVHRGARIAAVAHGGQVVLSAVTRELVDAPVKDLGLHRLKDLSGPQRLFQLGDGAFPPLKTLYRSNLPVTVSPFVGREREVADVRELLARADVRLLTLTGPGGTGKTRLALQAAAEVAEIYPDGVFWVPLATLREARLVLPTLAQALETKQEPAAYIGGKRMLLLLDNFEHLLDAASDVAALLAACANLRLLTTSREPLRITGERVYSVRPLDDRDAQLLFVERAVAVRWDFSTDGHVAEICRRLDGLPLAIELAAARVDVLSPAAILRRLAQRLSFLTGGPRDVPERQRTLRAAIEWSHELLSPEEKALFASLSVFVGGCRVDAAEAICDRASGVSMRVGEGLFSLAQKNLLWRSDDADGEPRFGMLETVREYALERLEHSGDAGQVRQRHVAFFVAFSEAAESEFDWRDEAEWYGKVESEYANLDAALVHSYESSDFASVLRIISGAWRYWLARRPEEGRLWIERSLSESVASPLRERATSALAWFTLVRGDFERAKALGEQLRAGAEATDDQVGLGRALNLLAFTAREEGDLDRARALATESLAIARMYDDDVAVATRLANLGTIERTHGSYAEAAEHLEESIGISRRHGVEPYYALSQLALVEIGRDNVTRALPLLGEALRRLAGSLDTRNIIGTLEAIAAAFAANGDPERASRLRDAADAARESSGLALDSDDLALRAATLNAIEKQLGTGAPREAPDEPMPLDDAVRFALEPLARR